MMNSTMTSHEAFMHLVDGTTSLISLFIEGLYNWALGLGDIGLTYILIFLSSGYIFRDLISKSKAVALSVKNRIMEKFRSRKRFSVGSPILDLPTTVELISTLRDLSIDLRKREIDRICVNSRSVMYLTSLVEDRTDDDELLSSYGIPILETLGCSRLARRSVESVHIPAPTTSRRLFDAPQSPGRDSTIQLPISEMSPEERNFAQRMINDHGSETRM